MNCPGDQGPMCALFFINNAFTQKLSKEYITWLLEKEIESIDKAIKPAIPNPHKYAFRGPNIVLYIFVLLFAAVCKWFNACEVCFFVYTVTVVLQFAYLAFWLESMWPSFVFKWSSPKLKNFHAS